MANTVHKVLQFIGCIHALKLVKIIKEFKKLMLYQYYYVCAAVEKGIELSNLINEFESGSSEAV